MSNPRDSQVSSTATIVRALRTPKGLILAVLVVILAIAGRVEGPLLALTGIAAAVASAAVPDALFVRWRDRRWHWPLSATITGLLVAAVLGVREPWYVAATASALGILSKRLLRTRWTNIVNPAAFGLVCVYYLFESPLSWWGALPGIVPGASWPLLAFTGIAVTERVRRWPIVLAFFVSYFALFTTATFFIDPREVAEVFVAPDLQAAVFFAAFMLTDPPTSPAPDRAQIIAGAIVGAASVAMVLTVGAAHFLLSGLLVGNVWESLRRLVVRRRATRRLRE